MGDLEIPYINPITKERMEELHNLIAPGPVLVVTHDNPDPDALSSGKALAFLFMEAWDVSSRLFYSGIVARAENKAMLRHLNSRMGAHGFLKWFRRIFGYRNGGHPAGCRQ